MSGLICLDWYDWNVAMHLCSFSISSHGRDWSVWIDTIETQFQEFRFLHHKKRRDWSVWIDTIETLYGHVSSSEETNMSGLICLDWYDWNVSFHNGSIFIAAKSGLICLDWYDWNNRIIEIIYVIESRRDWSVWIDTIETSIPITHLVSALIRSGLICLDWYDWNPSGSMNLELQSFSSGLICLDWYDWNACSAMSQVVSNKVGIDLFGLIRLKQWFQYALPLRLLVSGLICLDWYDWNSSSRYWEEWFQYGSGLICLDWYDWNQAWNNLASSGISQSGLICLDWYDWNFCAAFIAATEHLLSGLICLDWYDWNLLIPLLVIIHGPCRDWSVWIDTIETHLFDSFWKFSYIVGIDLFGLIRLKPCNTGMYISDPSAVGIDLFGLIRLKRKYTCFGVTSGTLLSGLICLDWYDWNFPMTALYVPSSFLSGLICLDWYDWN